MFDFGPSLKSVSRGYKVIGIVGSRRRNSTQDFHTTCEKFLSIFNPNDRIVSGGCPKGADSFAERIAKDNQCSITIHYAPWDRLGKGAGFWRNTFIAEECDVLIALPATDRTGGTEDTIAKALKLGKEVILI